MKEEKVNVENVAEATTPDETPVMSTIDKQRESMKKRWQDPEYRKRVAEGRARAKAAREAAKAAAEAAEKSEEPASTPAETPAE